MLVQYAGRLHARATGTIIIHIIVGCIVGGLIGYLPVIVWFWASKAPSWTWTPAPDSYVGFGVIIGAAVFGLIGNAKAFKHKLLAQTTLCHVQIERNTRKETQG